MTVTAYAPASIGNVSLGFDVLGAALRPIDGSPLGDRVRVVESGEYQLEVTGAFADKLPAEPSQNIVTHCYQHFCQAMQQAGLEMLPLALTLEKNLPIGSGLGSSASSIVAAFVALNDYFHKPFSDNQLLLMMGELEGQISGSIHYDNVAPCFLGGMTLMSGDDNEVALSLPVFDNWYWVACYSGISVSTSAARKILPTKIEMADTLTFGRQLAVFVHSLYRNNPSMAASVMQDVIAEPHRKSLLPGFDQAKAFCQQQQALAFGISGSGPTVFAVCDSLQQAQTVHNWLEANYIQNQYGFSHICQIDRQGANTEQKG